MRGSVVCHRDEPAGRTFGPCPVAARGVGSDGNRFSAFCLRREGESRDVHSAGLATVTAPGAADAVIFGREGLDRLVEVLIADGYQVIGPTVRDSAIVLDRLDSAAGLPAGWGVDTAPGRYRLRQREDAAVFANSAGPQSWKQFLHPPRRQLWSAGPDGEFRPVEPVSPRYAFLGVRGCDLAAIGILGRVLGRGAHPDGSFERAPVTARGRSW